MGQEGTSHKDSWGVDTLDSPDTDLVLYQAAPKGPEGWTVKEGTKVGRLTSGNSTGTLIPIANTGEEHQKNTNKTKRNKLWNRRSLDLHPGRLLSA